MFYGMLEVLETANIGLRQRYVVVAQDDKHNGVDSGISMTIDALKHSSVLAECTDVLLRDVGSAGSTKAVLYLLIEV